MRVDKALLNLYEEYKRAGKVKTFPEFTRLISSEIRFKKNELRFFK